MDKLFGNITKKYAYYYFQLKTRHGAIGTFLVRIRVTETLKS